MTPIKCHKDILHSLWHVATSLNDICHHSVTPLKKMFLKLLWQTGNNNHNINGVKVSEVLNVSLESQETAGELQQGFWHGHIICFQLNEQVEL